MGTFRTLINEVYEDITANVPALADAQLFKSKPLWYPPGPPCLASWFEEEEVFEEGPTGGRWFREFYFMRYWEDATDDEQRFVDDEAALAVEDCYEAVRARFMTADAQLFGDSLPMWPVRGRLIVGGNMEDGFVRGWELVYRAHRPRPFSE